MSVEGPERSTGRLTSWRKDIEKVKAEAAGKACPDCGEGHDADAGEASNGDFQSGGF